MLSVTESVLWWCPGPIIPLLLSCPTGLLTPLAFLPSLSLKISLMFSSRFGILLPWSFPLLPTWLSEPSLPAPLPWAHHPQTLNPTLPTVFCSAGDLSLFAGDQQAAAFSPSQSFLLWIYLWGWSSPLLVLWILFPIFLRALLHQLSWLISLFPSFFSFKTFFLVFHITVLIWFWPPLLSFSPSISAPCTKCPHGFICPSSLDHNHLSGCNCQHFLWLVSPLLHPFPTSNYFRRSAPRCFLEVTNSA